MNREEVVFEERKREACWDPAVRWRVLQETISWVDSQQPMPRNSPRGCQEAQARLLAQLARRRDKLPAFSPPA